MLKKFLIGMFFLIGYVSFGSVVQAQYIVDFEGGSEFDNGYNQSTVELNGLDWYIGDGAVIYNAPPDPSDRKNGTRSARIAERGSFGGITMAENKTNGLGTVSFLYARRDSSGDRSGTSAKFVVEYSTNDGGSWTQTGSETDLTGVDTLTTFSSTVNVGGNVRIRIRQTAGDYNKRWNVDDIVMTDYIPDTTPPATPLAAPDLQASSDNGRSDSDNIISDFPLTFDVVCTEVDSIINLVGETFPCSSIGTMAVTPTSPPVDSNPPGTFDMVYEFSYIETDASGNNSGQSPILSLTVDTIAPSAPSITVPSNDNVISGTAEIDSLVQVTTASGSTCTTITDGSGNYQCTLSPDSIDGEDASATTTDVAGNTSSITVETGAISNPLPVVNNSSSKSGSRRLSQAEVDKIFGKAKTESNEETNSNEIVEIKCFINYSRLIKRGVIGEDVKDVQRCMNSLGYTSGPEDGIYGPLTYAGVTAYQSDKNLLYIDGIVGPETSASLNKLSTITTQ